jgi:hypothetical protein
MSNVIFDILHVPTLYPFGFVLAISIAIGRFVCGKTKEFTLSSKRRLLFLHL